MINLNAFLCAPLQFKPNITIYPPRVKDTLNPNFMKYWSVLLLSQEEIEDIFKQQLEMDKTFQVPTPFEFLILNSYNSKEYEKTVIEAFEFFTKKTITFLYEAKTIVIGNISEEIKKVNNISELTFLKEEEFFSFQNMLRYSLGVDILDPPDPDMHPAKKRMLALQRMRDKAKARQQQKNGITFNDIIVSICCMNMGINPLNVGELSYASVNYLVEAYQKKEKYELDINSLLAGADSKKVHPVYWIGNEKK